MRSHRYPFLSLALAACAAPTPAPNAPIAVAPPVASTPAVQIARSTCPNGTRPAADGLIADFEGEARASFAGREQSWWVAGDKHTVISLPTPAFATAEGGPAGSKQAIHFVGTTSYEDDWGAAVAVTFLPAGFYDASKYAGIAFKIKSAKPNFNVRLKLPDVSSHPDGGQCQKHCWNSFGKELVVAPAWQDVVLTWSDVSQQPDWGDVRPPAITPSKLKGIEWTVYPGPEFDFWVDDIHFLECK